MAIPLTTPEFCNSLAFNWHISWTPHYSFRRLHFSPIMNGTHTLTILETLPDWVPQSLADGNAKAALITAFAGIVIVTLSKYRSQSSVQHDRAAIHELGGWSRFTAWPFFSRRYNFLHSTWEKTGAELFRFRVLQVRRLVSTSKRMLITCS